MTQDEQLSREKGKHVVERNKAKDKLLDKELP